MAASSAITLQRTFPYDADTPARARRSRTFRASRATFAANFDVQNSVFVAGVVAYLHPSCRCQ